LPGNGVHNEKAASAWRFAFAPGYLKANLAPQLITGGSTLL